PERGRRQLHRPQHQLPETCPWREAATARLRELEGLIGLVVASVLLAAAARRVGSPYPLFLAFARATTATAAKREADREHDKARDSIGAKLCGGGQRAATAASWESSPRGAAWAAGEGADTDVGGALDSLVH